MKTTSPSKTLLAGANAVIWLGAIVSLALSAAIGVRAGLAIGAMSGVMALLLAASALALVQIAQAMREIAASTALLAGRAAAPETILDEEEPDEPEERPVVTPLEPRFQSQTRVEPPLHRPGGEPGVLRAVRG